MNLTVISCAIGKMMLEMMKTLIGLEIKKKHPVGILDQARITPQEEVSIRGLKRI